MIDEQEEALIPSGVSGNSTEDEHICTNADLCQAPPTQDLPGSNDRPTVSPVFKKSLSARLIALFVIGLALLAVAGSGLYVYSHASTDKYVQAITNKIPFPAMMVGRIPITFSQYISEQDAMKKYFASSGQEAALPQGDDLKAMVVQTLANKAIVQKLANDYGVHLDPKAVQDFYQNFLSANAGQSEEGMRKQLQETFGWTPEQFKKRIVEPVVLSNEVSDYIAKSAFFQKPLRDEIDSAHKRVTEGKENFETVAKEVHTRVEIDLNSDLGFLKKSDLPSSWGSQVAALSNGSVSDVIELPQGYAIFKVTDHVKTGTDDEQLHVFAITVPKKTLDQIVTDYLKTHPAKVFIKV